MMLLLMALHYLRNSLRRGDLMKMIVISEEVFYRLFDEAIKSLDLDTLREKNRAHYASVDALHSKFRYEVSLLRDRIVKG